MYCQEDDEAYCWQKVLYSIVANAKVRLASKCIKVTVRYSIETKTYNSTESGT